MIERDLANFHAELRTNSTLLSYLPSGAVVYGTVPNPGITIDRALSLAEEQSAQNNPDIRVQLHIEPLDDPGPAPPLDDATLAQRIDDTLAFVRATSTGMRVFGEPNPAPVPFVSNEPNSVGPPWSFRATGQAVAGAVDIFYSSGSFDLAPDETSLSLNTKCFAHAIETFTELLPELASGTTVATAQPSTGRTYFARHRRPEAACRPKW